MLFLLEYEILERVLGRRMDFYNLPQACRWEVEDVARMVN